VSRDATRRSRAAPGTESVLFLLSSIATKDANRTPRRCVPLDHDGGDPGRKGGADLPGTFQGGRTSSNIHSHAGIGGHNTGKR